MRILTLLVFISISVLSPFPGARAFNFNNALVDAADAGNKEIVLQLLRGGTPPDSKGDFGVTALMRAAFRGNADIVQMLIESGAYVNAADIGGDTALHLASRNGHVEVVKALIYYDAYIDMPDKEKWTPLMRAVLAKKTEVANLLIEKGADLNATNQMDESILIHASMVGKPEIMELILGNENFAKIPLDHRKEAMRIAEKKGHEKVGRMIAATVDYMTRQVASVIEPPEEEIDREFTTKFSMQEEHMPPEQKLPPVPMLKERAKHVKKDTKPNQKDIKYTEALPWLKQKDRFISPPIKEKFVEKSEFDMAKTPSFPEPVSKPDRKKYDDKKDYLRSEQFFSMQLGAFSDDNQAFYVWDNLKNKNTDILSSFEPNVIYATDRGGEGDIYRLQAGHFKWKDTAESTCSSLRTRNIECFVVKGSTNQRIIARRQERQDTPDIKASQVAIPQTKPPFTAPIDIDPLSQKPGYMAHTPEAPMDAQPKQPYGSYSSVAPQRAEAELPWLQEPDYLPKQVWNLPQPPSYPVQYEQPPYPEQDVSGYDAPSPAAQPPGATQPDYNQQQPIDLLAQPAPQYTPQQKQELINEEIRRMARKEFFRQQGIKDPTIEKDYDDFYRQMEQKPELRAPVSEAVLVPDDTYFANDRNNYAASGDLTSRDPRKSGSWLQIDGFPDKASADDYGIRMFRYDENLSHLQIRLFDKQTQYGVQASMQVGPLDTAQAGSLCGTVRTSGLRCSIRSYGNNSQVYSGNNNGHPTRNKVNGQPSPINGMAHQGFRNYWVNLGTFADMPEAEYYWMFLKEDNEDILGSLKYDMAGDIKHDSFGTDAVQLKVGPFVAKDRANQICNIMRYRNVACLVAQ